MTDLLGREGWLAVALFAWTVVGAVPSADWLDAGNLVGSAWVLGVAHPPGEPAYLAIAKLAQLVPVGDIAFRTNLLSGACLALLVFPLAAIGRVAAAAADQRLCLGLVAGVLLALGARTQGVRAEVYAPVALVLAGALATALTWRGARASAGVGLLVGLGAAIHPLLVAAAVPALLAARLSTGEVRVARDAVAGLVAGVVGFAAYAWLPLRAAANPARAWGIPDSPERFLDVLLARTFNRNFGSDEVGSWLENLQIVGLLESRAGLPLLALCGVLGLVARKDRKVTSLGVVALLWVVGNACTILPQNKVFPTNPDLLGYLFVGVLGAVPLGMAGVRRIGPRAGTFVAVVAAVLALDGAAANRPHGWGARSFAVAQTAGLPTGAVLVPSGNSSAFAWAWLGTVERRRVDLVVIPRILMGHPHELARLGGPGAIADLGLVWHPSFQSAPLEVLRRGRRPAFVEIRDGERDAVTRHGLVGSVTPGPSEGRWLRETRRRVLEELSASRHDHEALAVRAWLMLLWGDES